MIVLDSGDKLRGDAAAASVVDYTIYGLDNNVLKQLADGQLSDSTGDIYTADSVDVVTTLIFVNTDSSARAINLFVLPSGGTARRVIPKDLSLGIGYSLHWSGDKITIMNPSGAVVSSTIGVNTSGTPVANDIARFTDADTVEGRSYTELKSDLSLGTAADRAAEDTLTDGSNLPDGAAIKAYGDANWSASGVDTSGSPEANDFGRFVDADTIEGRSYTEVRSDLNIEDGADVTDTANVTAAGALMDSEVASGTIGSSGASLVAINTINGTEPDLQMFVDGTQSSQYYSGGIVTKNSANDGTIDITAITGYIKREDDNEAMNMGSFEIAEVSGQALSSGINMVCVDYDGGTPIFSIETSLPNRTTIFPFSRVYKDDNDHLHIVQGGNKFLGLPLKVTRRLLNVDGLVRASGMVTTEGTEDLTLDVSAGVLWRGLNEFSFGAYDGDEICDITGSGTGGTVSATSKIVLDSGCGDLTATFVHGLEIRIHDSSNGNDGCYHVDSSQLINGDANTEVTIETTDLTTGNDTGHVHTHVFTYWNYTADNGWIETNQNGDHVSILIDNTYWNDITQNEGSQFDTFPSQKPYGVAWVYASSAQDSRVHVVYGQNEYTLGEAAEAAAPSTLPDIINKMCFLVAKITFEGGETEFYSILYPWDTTFAATGAADHGGLAGLDGDDHPQYIKDSEFTQDSGVLVGTGAGEFAEETGSTLRTSIGCITEAESIIWAIVFGG